jgi:uncharacterized protein (TIGR00290 family)
MKIAMCWSGGKDSCVALHELRSSSEFEVAVLLTTLTSEYDRISMHGVPRSLLHRQVQALGLPLREILIPVKCSNADYETAMGEAFANLRIQGIETVAYGDLFLADIRAYRDALMSRHSMKAVYPVWGQDTRQFILNFIGMGFEAVTCCVDLNVLPEDFAGRVIDENFLGDLPDGIDPCGENGEFHTFVFNGPGFAERIPIHVGERAVRGRFAYCDLQPDRPAPVLELRR